MEVKGMNGCLFTQKLMKKSKTRQIRIKNFRGDSAFRRSDDLYNEICSHFDELWIVDTKYYGIATISSADVRKHAVFYERGDGFDIQIYSENLRYLCTPQTIDVSMKNEEIALYNKKAFAIITSLFERKYQ